MAEMAKLEDMAAWQMARELASELHDANNEGLLTLDCGLRDDMRRAAVSVMSNMIEGYDCDGEEESLSFLAIARESTGELKAQLHVALAAGMIDQRAFDSLYNKAVEIGNLLRDLMGCPNKGYTG